MITKKGVVEFRREVKPVGRQVKLRQNVILDGELVKRGSIISEDLLPEFMRGQEEYVDYDLDPTGGCVMMLHNVMYNGQYGASTLEAGELLKLDNIPERVREDWKEGKDYLVNWTESDRHRLRRQADAEYERNVFGKGPVGDTHVSPEGVEYGG